MIFYKDSQKLFIRFLKEKGLYQNWYEYCAISLNKYEKGDFMSWFNHCDCFHYIMNGFSWGDYNQHYHCETMWGLYHREWEDLIATYLIKR